MEYILRNIQLIGLLENFEKEEITPELVHLLSEEQFDHLGVPHNQRIRTELKCACASLDGSVALSKMDQILQEINLSHLARQFAAEEITPELVCTLSAKQMDSLGVPQDNSQRKRPKKACSLSGIQPDMENDQGALERMLKEGYTARQIASVFSISELTVYRRLNTLGLHARNYTEISDVQLRQEIKEIQKTHPNEGEVMLRSFLVAGGIRVSRERVREACHNISPTDVSRRRKGRLHRRVYHTVGPNHLWHIDGNHKLIRWRFVIHGGVDGYSRLPVYLLCATNNKAATVLCAFKAAALRFGLPLRVRSDCGGENIKVKKLMENFRGTDRGSMIMGKSTHNQRIERLWRDVYKGCLSFFYNLFSQMEDEGILDTMDEHQMYCLHYVYKDRINRSLEEWIEAWSYHKLRTEGMSPMQLFMSGQLPENSGTCAQDYFENGNEHGTEEPGQEETPTVELDNVHIEISDETQKQLQENINPLADSDSNGRDLFQQALNILLL